MPGEGTAQGTHDGSRYEVSGEYTRKRKVGKGRGRPPGSGGDRGASPLGTEAEVKANVHAGHAEVLRVAWLGWRAGRVTPMCV